MLRHACVYAHYGRLRGFDAFVCGRFHIHYNTTESRYDENSAESTPASTTVLGATSADATRSAETHPTVTPVSPISAFRLYTAAARVYGGIVLTP